MMDTKPKAPQVTQAPKPTVAPRAQAPKQPTVTPNLDSLKLKMVESNRKDMTEQERATVKGLLDKGKTKQADALVKTIRESNKAKSREAFDKSVPGAAANAATAVGKWIAGTAADTALRGGEIVDRLGAPIRGARIDLSKVSDADKARLKSDMYKKMGSWGDTRDATNKFFFGSQTNERGETQTQE